MQNMTSKEKFDTLLILCQEYALYIDNHPQSQYEEEFVRSSGHTYRSKAWVTDATRASQGLLRKDSLDQEWPAYFNTIYKIVKKHHDSQASLKKAHLSD